MKRQHPLLSPIGCLTALFLVAFILVSIYLTGGALFTPGKVSARAPQGLVLGGFTSHAGFENQCESCHEPWVGVSNVRCMDCHTDIQGQVSAGQGLHASIPQPYACADCHSEHHGRDHNGIVYAAARFEHDWIGFTLSGHQLGYDGAPMDCSACHNPDYDLEPGSCSACHAQADQAFMQDHEARYGSDCLLCHDGSPDSIFDHGFFALEDGHADLECKACHTAAAFAEASAACVTCHVEPDIHIGQFGTDCAACHRATNWREVQLVAHAFPLNHEQDSGQNIDCLVCHPANYVTYTCYNSGCHAQAETESEHLEEGIADFADCTACHLDGFVHEEDDD